MKCYTDDIPFESRRTISKLGIRLKTDIFPLAIRPHEIKLDYDGDISEGFSVQFHYQKQSFSNILFLKSFCLVMTETSSKDYSMNFNVQQVEVIRRRNKWKEACMEGIPDHDIHVYEKMMKRVGCRPPYWTSETNLTLCSDRDSMNRMSNMLLRFRTFIPDGLEHLPCRRLTMLQFDYTEMDEYAKNQVYSNVKKRLHLKTITLNILKGNSYKDKVDDRVSSKFKLRKVKRAYCFFDINVWFSNSRYKEVSSIREFGVQSLVGNIGGYIGIFIGYALMNVPELIASLFNRIRFFRKNNKEEKMIEDQAALATNDVNIDELAQKIRVLEESIEKRFPRIEKEIKDETVLETLWEERNISV